MVSGFSSKAIKQTKTVGQRLKDARRRLELTLPQAEQLTKVKLKYLKALEEDRHDLLPTEVYSLGFLRCYGEVLKLNTKKLLHQYQQERRALSNAKPQLAQHLAPARRLGGPRFLVTPKTLITFLSVALVAGLVIYIAYGVKSFLAPPKLTITDPKPDSRIASSTVTVAGQTEPTVSLTINGELVDLDPTGKFNRSIAMIPGLNILEFVAINRVGKETKLTRKILADYEVAAQSSPSPAVSPISSISPTVSPSVTSPQPTISPSP